MLLLYKLEVLKDESVIELTSKSVVASGILSLGDALSLVGVLLVRVFMRNCCLRSSENIRGSSTFQSTTFSIELRVFCICCAW